MKNTFVQITESPQFTTLTLNRPEKHNALNGVFIAELMSSLKKIAKNKSQLLVINASGENFCAGADILWMQKIAAGSSQQNKRDAKQLADLLYDLHHFPKITIALAQGKIFGGGLGLLCACDIAIAAENSRFGFPEVKMGLIPAVISPYVLAAIGRRAAAYYFLTGETFDTNEALRLQLIQKKVDAKILSNPQALIIDSLLKNGPEALKHAKKLIKKVHAFKINKNISKNTADLLAKIRVSKEATEGLNAFLEKRNPIF